MPWQSTTQFLSAALSPLPCSPDVAPPEFLRELEKLQDQIPPFCNDEARQPWPKGAD